MSAPMTNFIAGSWRSGADVIENVSPAEPDDVVGRFAAASTGDVAEAIEAARTGGEALAAQPLQLRSDTLLTIGQEIEAQAEDIATTLSREEGKPIGDARLEVVRAGQLFKYYAGEVLRPKGVSAPSLIPGVLAQSARVPLGVVSLITPWNFPAAIPAWKIAPALAFGNGVLFKPAEIACATAWKLSRIIAESALPDGAFNLLIGRGGEIGDALTGSDGINGVSFTGSEGVGQRILSRAADKRIAVQLELGGKNPLIIDDEADLETAVEVALAGAYLQTGQRCTAYSRLIVHRAVHGPFVEELAKRVAAIRVGDPLEAETWMGPVASAEQLAQNLDYLTIGKTEGAELLTGGDVIDGPGHFMRPAVFVGADNAMRISREEIFGPIATVIEVADLDEAIAVANDTAFGLTASIVTRSQRKAEEFRRQSGAGVVMINLPPIVDYHLPFGGRQASGFGPKEMGPSAAEFFTTSQTSYMRPM